MISSSVPPARLGLPWFDFVAPDSAALVSLQAVLLCRAPDSIAVRGYSNGVSPTRTSRPRARQSDAVQRVPAAHYPINPSRSAAPCGIKKARRQARFRVSSR